MRIALIKLNDSARQKIKDGCGNTGQRYRILDMRSEAADVEDGGIEAGNQLFCFRQQHCSRLRELNFSGGTYE